tara:strand:+ start:460 stop:852 length:393 start_codon:yes stop_codon:yes gene_type:complete
MFNLFKKKHQTNVETASDKDPVLSVTFKVDTLGHTDIEMVWLSDDDVISTLFAELIVNINSGEYSHSIMKILSDDLENSKNKEFITSTILKVKQITDKLTAALYAQAGENAEKPIVRPSEFSYNVVKNQQ